MIYASGVAVESTESSSDILSYFGADAQKWCEATVDYEERHGSRPLLKYFLVCGSGEF